MDEETVREGKLRRQEITISSLLDADSKFPGGLRHAVSQAARLAETSACRVRRRSSEVSNRTPSGERADSR